MTADELGEELLNVIADHVGCDVLDAELCNIGDDLRTVVGRYTRGGRLMLGHKGSGRARHRYQYYPSARAEFCYICGKRRT